MALTAKRAIHAVVGKKNYYSEEPHMIFLKFEETGAIIFPSIIPVEISAVDTILANP